MEDYVERSTFYVLSAISFYLFCSAGTTFLFNRRLNCEEEKSSEKVRPEEGSASQARRKICLRKLAAPTGIPRPPRLGVKVGAGKIKYSGIIMFCRNAFGY